MPSGRRFLPVAAARVKKQLATLIGAQGPEEYRTAITEVGESLGSAVRKKMPSPGEPFVLVSTPEDADFLVTGMLRSLDAEQARLICYWTDRRTYPGERDLATVVQSYVDPRIRRGIETVVIAKSIIASSCVVRTNLEKVLLELDPLRIIIAAPVMLRGAERRLKAAFPSSIAARFQFVSFAIDAHKDEQGLVAPGVGGMVEQRLGYVPSRRLPRLVSEWQTAIH